MKHCGYLAMTLLLAFSIKSLVYNQSNVGVIVALTGLISILEVLRMKDRNNVNQETVKRIEAIEASLNTRYEDVQAKIASLQIATGFTRRK